MTQEECLKQIEQIEKDYRIARNEVETKYHQDSDDVLNAWANDNSKYQIGDIIEANGIIIVIENILGNMYKFGSISMIYCIYKGHALTKHLQPRKDEWVTTIHDDGSREIKLLRKAKVD